MYKNAQESLRIPKNSLRCISGHNNNKSMDESGLECEINQKEINKMVMSDKSRERERERKREGGVFRMMVVVT